MQNSYHSDLLRGREIALGLETPDLCLPQVEGREEELGDLWMNANAADRAYIERAVLESEALLKKEGLVDKAKDL